MIFHKCQLQCSSHVTLEMFYFLVILQYKQILQKIGIFFSSKIFCVRVSDVMLDPFHVYLNKNGILSITASFLDWSYTFLRRVKTIFALAQGNIIYTFSENKHTWEVI